MDYLRFLGIFAIAARYFITCCNGESCVGLLCDHASLSWVDKNNTMAQNLHDAANASPGKNPHKSAKSLPFLGITDSRKLNKKCCQNGGTCFLGTFCICPKQFTGRHCERERRPPSCAGVPHGDWIQKDCLLCRCISGVLHCFKSEFEDCGHVQEEDDLRSKGFGMQNIFTIYRLFIIYIICTIFRKLSFGF
ncbi:hypothetical protein GDO86_001508 [Hymenochirus boettgeri]|uniref:EGF-like domain-containing protein n=1 Tax=Hymenochirus boettgeri TaxID=247094 RepID=A0A8T2KG01_9PIPI|nr:hypothetical protein GDO86_001508 [Hymenochirus boettgeri]